MAEVYPIEELLPYWVYRVQTEGVALLATYSLYLCGLVFLAASLKK